MHILIPPNLTVPNAIKFCSYADNIEHASEYLITLNLNLVEPFGMLLIAAKIREFRAKHSNSKFKASWSELNSYAAHMGFFKSLGLNQGMKPGEAPGSSTYVPITSVPIGDFVNKAKNSKEHVGETVEKYSRELAYVLSRDDEILAEYLTYSFRELIRNIIEHSRSQTVWFAAQYWPAKNLVEVAILDEGIGIRKGLSGNPHLQLKSDEDALLMAIEPGVSGKAYKGTNLMDESEWENSGFGLYMTSSLCQNGGFFVLCSGSRALLIDGNFHEITPASFQGTALCMRLKTENICQLSETTKRLVTEGEKRARKNKRLFHATLTASKVSRFLVTGKD